MIELVVDRFLQFCGVSLVESLVEKVAKVPHFVNGLIKIEMVFMNKNLMVINKPPDLVINSNDKSKPSVQNCLREQFHELVDTRLFHDFYFVHRLDCATSGLLCIPLNRGTCAEVSQLLEGGCVDGCCLAIVGGRMNQEGLCIDVPVGEDVRFRTSNNKMCTSHDWERCLDPRSCVTGLLVLERGFYDKEFATKVLLRPVAGRRRRLRVHCNEIGHPIVGDFTCSGRSADSCPAMPGMMLHAFRMILPLSTDTLDLRTQDPFLPEDTKWSPKVQVGSIEDAFDGIGFVWPAAHRSSSSSSAAPQHRPDTPSML